MKSKQQNPSGTFPVGYRGSAEEAVVEFFDAKLEEVETALNFAISDHAISAALNELVKKDLLLQLKAELVADLRLEIVSDWVHRTMGQTTKN
jgi:hypothetical protein